MLYTHIPLQTEKLSTEPGQELKDWNMHKFQFIVKWQGHYQAGFWLQPLRVRSELLWIPFSKPGSWVYFNLFIYPKLQLGYAVIVAQFFNSYDCAYSYWLNILVLYIGSAKNILFPLLCCGLSCFWGLQSLVKFLGFLRTAHLSLHCSFLLLLCFFEDELTRTGWENSAISLSNSLQISFGRDKL